MSLPPDFAETGLHVSHTGTTPITRYQVLGERSSGTNFVKRLLGRNSVLTPTETLGWKHGFATMMAIPSDLAVICVVRSADSWARSMFDKPWHTTPAMQSLSFSDFLRARWDTIIDRPRYFGALVDQKSIGAPLQQDRHPLTGATFENLFALRQAKLTALLGLLERNCTCVILRMETAQDAPEMTRDIILKALQLPPHTAPFRPVIKRLGSKFKPAIADRSSAPDTWQGDDLGFLRASIDTELEAALGYSYA